MRTIHESCVLLCRNPGSSLPRHSCCRFTYLLFRKQFKTRRKDELISDVLLWTPTRAHTNVIRQVKIYIHPLNVDSECRLQDSSRTVSDKDGRQERVKRICNDGTRWWWWCSFHFSSIISICVISQILISWCLKIAAFILVVSFLVLLIRFQRLVSKNHPFISITTFLTSLNAKPHHLVCLHFSQEGFAVIVFKVIR